MLPSGRKYCPSLSWSTFTSVQQQNLSQRTASYDPGGYSSKCYPRTVD